MKTTQSALLISLVCFTFAAIAQTNPADVKYRRSSLFTLIIDDAGFPRADVIKDAFIKYPVPDKFNDHNLNTRTISGKAVAKDQLVIINNYLEKNNVAKEMVAKWFNRRVSGAFDMNLVAERGSYNASEMDANVAKQTKRGLAILADAGEELIKNTFVVVSDFKYIPDSVYVKKLENINDKAKEIKNVASRLPGLPGPFGKLPGGMPSVGDAGIKVLKNTDGYWVQTTSYLFRLHWDDSVAAVFYNDYWMDSTSVSPQRKAAFDSSHIFYMDFIGKDEAAATVQSFKLLNKPEQVLIAQATVNAQDAVIAKLQKSYPEFRTKTPLASTDPCTAKIGLKEGLEANDNYEVLVQSQNAEGRTTYEKVGNISVNGKQIWDNRYMAEKDTVTNINSTLFKGGNKKMAPGMLIRQK